MIFVYSIRQDGAEVSLTDTDDHAARDKAHRIARKSLETGSGAVTIYRKRGPDKWRLVATLTRKEPVAAGERWG